MLPFLRSDLANLTAYTPHPGGQAGSPVSQASSDLGGTGSGGTGSGITESRVLDRLDTNENPYDLPAELKQKLAWVYQESIESNRYPDGAYWALKQAIAAYVTEASELAEAITPDQISIGNGSDELIRSLLIATCLGGEGAILVAQPTFSMYGILAQTLGIPVVTVDRSAEFELNLAAAQAALSPTLDDSAAVPIRAVFMVHPNSPTANLLTPAELDWLRSLPDRILVVIDEAYFEFSQHSLVAELAQRSNWVILRTFSKAFRLAAHRVGYAIAHPGVISALEKVRLPYNLPATTQMAALWAMTHRQSLLSVIPELLHERDRLYQALKQSARLQTYPSAANFIFVRPQTAAGEALTAPALEDYFQTLRQQGTLLRKIHGGFRITVGSPAENQRTIDRLCG